MPRKAKKARKHSILLIVALFCVLSSAIVFFIALQPIRAEKEKELNVLVVYDGSYKKFLESLAIDKSINVKSSEDTSELLHIDESTDIIVLLDVKLSSSEKNNLSAFVNNGGGLFIVCGPHITKSPSILNNFSIIESGSALKTNFEPFVLTPEEKEHEISKAIVWNSAPDLKNITIIKALDDSMDNIIRGYPISKSLTKDDYHTMIYGEKDFGSGKISIFTGWMDDTYNSEYKLWPYFNYFLYAILLSNQNEDIPAYYEWEYSPVPHLFEQLLLLGYIIILTVLALLLFKAVKKRSADNPIDEVLLVKEEKNLELKEVATQKPQIESNPLIIKDTKENKLNAEREDLKSDWEQIGTHRQISGYFFYFFIGVLVVLPQLLIVGFLMPRYIQPFPQASGYFNFATTYFQAIWMLFDVGTSAALAKYFAQHRVQNPSKAIHYIQIFVWWQTITGIVQIIIVAFIGSIIFPRTEIAHMTWIFIFHSLIQYPGFFMVFVFIFQGLQRSDLQTIGQVLAGLVLGTIGQIIFILVFRAWGVANPIYGEALGAGIGYAIGVYFAEWTTFLITMIIFKRLGYSVKRIFRIDFSREELKQVLKYGIKLTAGNIWVPAVLFFQIVLVAIYVSNYSNEIGYYNLASTLGGIIGLIGFFMSTLLSSFSEAYENKRPALVKLYVYQGFKWGNYLTFPLFIALLAAGDYIILGAAGETWARATYYLVVILIFQLLGPYSWLGDSILMGTGKTQWAAVAWVLEQAIRALLLWILLAIFQDMLFVMIAYIPALIIKDLFMWIIIKKKVCDFKLFPWSSFIAPGIASIIGYFVLRAFAVAIWQVPTPDKIVNVLIMYVVAVFGFLYLFAFLVGFFGGFDNNTLKEFERASKMIKGVGFFTRALYFATLAGCKASPGLHDRFKVTIFQPAMEEAHALTLEKKRLKI